MPCTTGFCCATSDALAAASASSATILARIIIAASLNRGRASGRARPEPGATAQNHLLSQRPRLSVAQRRDDRGDLVAGLEQIDAPPGAIQDARARALDQPAL